MYVVFQALAHDRMQELADIALAENQRSLSCRSAASLEMYQSIYGGDRGLLEVDKDRISMKSDCGINMNRQYGIVLNGQHKVLGISR